MASRSGDAVRRRDELEMQQVRRKIEGCRDPRKLWRAWDRMRNSQLKAGIKTEVWDKIFDLCNSENEERTSEVGRIVGIPLNDETANDALGVGKWQKAGYDYILKDFADVDRQREYIRSRSTEDRPLALYFPPLNGADDTAGKVGHVLVFANILEGDRSSVRELCTSLAGDDPGWILTGDFVEENGSRGKMPVVFENESARDRVYCAAKSGDPKPFGADVIVRKPMSEGLHKAFLFNFPMTDDWGLEKVLIDKGVTGIVRVRISRDSNGRYVVPGKAMVVFASRQDALHAETVPIRMMGRMLRWYVPDDSSYSFRPPSRSVESTRPVVAQGREQMQFSSAAEAVASNPAQARVESNDLLELKRELAKTQSMLRELQGKIVTLMQEKEDMSRKMEEETARAAEERKSFLKEMKRLRQENEELRKKNGSSGEDRGSAVVDVVKSMLEEFRKSVLLASHHQNATEPREAVQVVAATKRNSMAAQKKNDDLCRERDKFLQQPIPGRKPVPNLPDDSDDDTAREEEMHPGEYFKTVSNNIHDIITKLTKDKKLEILRSHKVKLPKKPTDQWLTAETAKLLDSLPLSDILCLF